MLGVFSSLSAMLSTSAASAIFAAFIWGILSVVLSPCHLSGVPLLMGHIVRKSGGTKSAGLMSFVFALGILATLFLIAIVTSLLGRLLGDVGPGFSVAVGILMVLMGLNLTGLFGFPEFSVPAIPKFFFGGYGESFLLGLLFGIVLGPCSFAFMAPVLGTAFQTSRANPVMAVALFSMYALGHCTVIVLGGSLTGWVKTYLAWNEKSGIPAAVKKTCGIFVVLGGVYIIMNVL